ncbi:MAG: hypothetical protein M3S32_10065 [Acidobacteriota bacterium]|nr:hypothetical protein [Acidobacteriota bacterium]
MRRIALSRLPSRLACVAVAALMLSSPLLAYNVKLKDGSIIFARTKYEVKGKKAIITLQNGTVTSYDLSQIDIPGTEQYNKDNPGNVLVIDNTGDSQLTVPLPTPNPTVSLQDVIRKKKVSLDTRTGRNTAAENAAAASMQVDAAVDQAFRKVLDGAGIAQYRPTSTHGKIRFLATTNNEETVFNTISAAARAVADLAARGRDISAEIVLTTSGGESGGVFEMNADQARLIVNGNITVADYFLKNVIL